MSLDWSSVKALSIPVGGVSRDVKRVSVGGVTLWEKPNPLPYDAEVEYIESTGTQYIDTGIDAAMDIDMSVDAVSLNTQSTQFHAMGVFAPAPSGLGKISYALFCSSIGSIQCAVGDGSQNRVTATGLDWSTRRTVELKSGELFVDGTSYGFPPTVPSALDYAYSIYVCGLNGLGGMALHPGKWYGAKIYKNGVLVRDYIPVRVGSGANAVGYLYDRANPTGGPLENGLYGSGTAVPLVAGPDKSP